MFTVLDEIKDKAVTRWISGLAQAVTVDGTNILPSSAVTDSGSADPVPPAAAPVKPAYPPAAPLPTQSAPAGIRFDFNQGARLELPPRKEGRWRVRLRDLRTGNILFESENQGARVLLVGELGAFRRHGSRIFGGEPRLGRSLGAAGLQALWRYSGLIVDYLMSVIAITAANVPTNPGSTLARPRHRRLQRRRQGPVHENAMR